MQHGGANQVSKDRALGLVSEHGPDAILVLESILHQMSEAVIVADLQHRFLVFNPAAERMFGRFPGLSDLADVVSANC